MMPIEDQKCPVCGVEVGGKKPLHFAGCGIYESLVWLCESCQFQITINVEQRGIHK